jgi:chromosome condensin MukBEF complex kleisin-like MukF subunit
MTRINENAPTALRRRLSHDNLKNDIQNILEYEINPNHYSNVGDFISDVCDWMVSNISDDMEYEHNIKIQYKDKDKLYHFLVNNFGEMIAEYYKKNKKGNLKESVKKYVISESRYKKLVENKLGKKELFQDLVNEKLEDIKNQCEDLLNDYFNVGFQSCHEVEVVDSIVVNEVEMMSAGRTDMYGNMHDVTSSIYVKLTINYSNIKDVYDFDDLTYDLKWMLKNSTGGLPIVFDYRTNNLNKIKE